VGSAKCYLVRKRKEEKILLGLPGRLQLLHQFSALQDHLPLRGADLLNQGRHTPLQRLALLKAETIWVHLEIAT
jgi:hypothetical protein